MALSDQIASLALRVGEEIKTLGQSLSTGLSAETTARQQSDQLLGLRVDELWEAGAVPTTLTGLRYPAYIAHRGSPLCYPEHSMEAYRASHAAGFAPEADVRALSDGTLVCLHDATTTRTMDITGTVASKTPAEWRAAKVKPPVNRYISGTRWGTPVFFDDYLDEFGGRCVLMPEIKVTGDAIQAAIQAVIERGLQRSVVLQSFDYATCLAVVGAGIPALFLNPSSAAGIAADGIEYVGVPMAATNALVTSLKNAGLRVMAYGAVSKPDVDAQLARGCDGVFVDDPWEASREYPPTGALDLAEGYVPPGSRTNRPTWDPTPGTSTVTAEPGSLIFSAPDSVTRGVNLKLGSLGYGGPSAKIRLWVQGLTSNISGGNSWMFGLALGRQDGDEPINEEPTDGVWRLAMVRRDGRKHAYEKRTNTGDTTSLGATSAPSTPYAPNNSSRSIPMLFEVEFTTTQVIIRNLTLNDTDLVASNTAWTATGGLYLTLRNNGADSRMWGIHAVWT